MILPASPIRGCSWPFPVHTFPTYRLLLRPETCLTELAATVAVCLAALKHSSEDFCLGILAVGASHGREPPLLLNDARGKTASEVQGGRKARNRFSSPTLRVEAKLGYSSWRRTRFFGNYLCWPDFLLDKRSHYLLMVINRKKLKSTRDAAKELGVHAITLHRYILAKKVPAPEIQMVGGVKVRLWSQKDIDRVRELLPKIANGRTKKGKKRFAK